MEIFKKTELSDEKVVSILKDILEKYPKGESGKMKKSDYTSRRQWRPSTGHYGLMTVDTNRKPGKLFGYDISTLKRFVYAMDGQYRYAVRELYRDESGLCPSSKSVSRRTNRAVDRISQIDDCWEISEVSSIYRVTFGSMYSYSYGSNWTNPTVIVVASNEKAATFLGKTVAAGAGIILEDDKIHVRRLSVADKHILENVKSACLKDITSSLSKLKKDAERTQKQIEQLMNFSVSLTTFNDY